MTYLRINQLVVLKGKEIVYDQNFPHKINIIRGENGSGKSTLANFIYYALGGDFVEWLPEAKSCSDVLLEVDLSGKILTLKREVIDKMMQPMMIFFGGMEKALNAPFQSWLLYPYRKSENKESFTQFIFNQLGFPDVTTDNNETITINQVLRLMYIDQISPVNTFVKSVDFDSPLIRQAISYLLFGIYDNALFNDQLTLKEKRRVYADLNREYQAIKGLYQTSQHLTLDINAIETNIKENEELLAKIDETLINRDLLSQNIKKNDVFNTIRALKSDVEETSKVITRLLGDKSKVESEIFDSKQFIEELENQNEALNESLSTREILGGMSVSFCPSCLSRLDTDTPEDKCHLCKKELDIKDHKSRILRIQHEIQNQLKESKYLLDKRYDLIRDYDAELAKLKTTLANQNRTLNNYLENTNSNVDRKHDDLLVRKGALANQIENLNNQKKTIISFQNLKRRIEALDREIENLDERVKTKEDVQKKKMQAVVDRISYYSLILLRGDGIYEQAFQNARRIRIDFIKNLYYVDERNNFSASSLVILKNAIRFGIFFASVELEFMRFPRFLLCDNIEDKGMQPPRSMNFQRNVVELAKNLNGNFQIIMTTSMIDPTLENTDYTVGDAYTPLNKSLRLSSSKDSISSESDIDGAPDSIDDFDPI